MATIAENLTQLKTTKANIKSAIEAKGVSNVGDKFSDYPAKIASIPTGSTINNQWKTFTENGTYWPDSGYTGFKYVVVDVPSSVSIPDGLSFSYTTGSNTLNASLNKILSGAWSLRTSLRRMFSECQFQSLELDLRKLALNQTTTVDATGMFYDTTGLYNIKWPSSFGSNAQVDGTLMFANCSIDQLIWPSGLKLTNAACMFSEATISELNLQELDLHTDNVGTTGAWGLFLSVHNCGTLAIGPDLFNTKDDYNFSSFTEVTMLQGYSIEDQDAWTNFIQMFTFYPHSSQTLTLPTAWQTYIQQFNLESQLTSQWSSVAYV